MDYLSAKTRLKPVKRAWRSFTTNLQSRLRSLSAKKNVITNLIHKEDLFSEEPVFMAHLSSKTKLKPVKRAWRSFSNNLRSTLRSLSIVTRNKTASNLRLEFLLRRLPVPRRSRFLTKRPIDHCNRQQYRSQYRPYPRANYRAVYIDKLYGDQEEERFSSSQERGGTSKEKEVVGEEKVPERQEGLETIEDAWRAVVASTPHLGVDQRAEEFIKKIHMELRIERERSLLEFQEMMNRSVH